MDDLRNLINQWIAYDDKINEINDKIKKTQENTKELKKNKENISVKITQYLKDNNMEESSIEINNNKIKLQETSQYSSITLKFLKECLLHYFKDNNEEYETLFNFIKDNRQMTKKIDLQRKIIKDNN